MILDGSGSFWLLALGMTFSFSLATVRPRFSKPPSRISSSLPSPWPQSNAVTRCPQGKSGQQHPSEFTRVDLSPSRSLSLTQPAYLTCCRGIAAYVLFGRQRNNHPGHVKQSLAYNALQCMGAAQNSRVPLDCKQSRCASQPQSKSCL